ncbi:hypothetical protein C3R44_23370, partial [Mycobacterium tuberculosis]
GEGAAPSRADREAAAPSGEEGRAAGRRPRGEQTQRGMGERRGTERGKPGGGGGGSPHRGGGGGQGRGGPAGPSQDRERPRRATEERHT